ncbi:hypothetical protein KCU68_g267, partial [Aureobasidium melanogenum]
MQGRVDYASDQLDAIDLYSRGSENIRTSREQYKSDFDSFDFEQVAFLLPKTQSMLYMALYNRRLRRASRRKSKLAFVDRRRVFSSFVQLADQSAKCGIGSVLANLESATQLLVG